jgi:threonyl-tRNA synthetase
MRAKIRKAQLEKVPYMLVVGDREVEAGEVNLRRRDKSVAGSMSLDSFAELVQEAVEERRLL